jgi:hypothetical protein
VQVQIRFRIVVTDVFYGEDRGLRGRLRDFKIGYVLAFKPMYTGWHPQEEMDSFQEATQAGVRRLANLSV